MRKTSVLRVIACLFLTFGVVAAQDKATDFSGKWEMNIAKSKLPERTPVEATVMTVSQTDKELTVETAVKRGVFPASPARTQSGGIVDSPGVLTFNISPGETVETQSASDGSMVSTSSPPKAYFIGGGRLRLIQSSSVTEQSGESDIKTSDTWELSADGKTLKVKRERTTPQQRGVQSAEMYFVKTDAASLASEATPAGISDRGFETATLADVNGGVSGAAINPVPDKSMTGVVVAQKIISGGVLNAKALQMPKPAYPAAARAAKASGTVNVQVTVGESGAVVAATAVSGHPLLRAAAVEAARAAKFAPVLVQGIPVKITGVLVYKFNR